MDQSRIFRHKKYLESEIKVFESDEQDRKAKILDELNGLEIERVIDIGCGAGQELMPFAEMDGVLCSGIDVSESSVEVFKSLYETQSKDSRPTYVRGCGTAIPFADNSFDVAICRVALPYMDNRSALQEIGRILRPGGRLILRTHTPMFYLGMVGRRLQEKSAKRLAYPVICIVASLFYWLTGHRFNRGLMRGKEVFQTTGTIVRDIRTTNLKIVKDVKSRCGGAKNYVLEKVQICNLMLHSFLESEVLFLGFSVIH